MQVAESIRGSLGKAGDPAPSIAQLVEEHEVARQTAAKALKLLAAEGVLVKFAGLGYFVTESGASGRKGKRR